MVRTNPKVTPLQAVLRYRDLLEIESLFRAAKATFNNRPIFHQSDAAIPRHVFCSFLALVLSKELRRLCRAKGLTSEWQPLLRDLYRLQEATIERTLASSPPEPTSRAKWATSFRQLASLCHTTSTNNSPEITPKLVLTRAGARLTC